jgi:NAD-dependent dihydropyrimidine dehydrogenase PreA subunit
MAYVITGACADIMDRACVDQCPVDCIQPGERMLYINPDQCIDCGACEPACPQKAIFPDYDLPGPLEAYRSVNAEFFSGAEYGPATPDDGRPASIDHPIVVELPRKTS